MTDRPEPARTRARSGVDPGEIVHGRRVLGRAALVLLAAAALYQGIWAQLAPRSFFQDFPGGEGWIAGDGPYNEHLTRDIGGLVNGLAVIAIVAAWTMSKPLLVATTAGWLVYALPHLAYHLTEPLDDAGAQTINVLVLSSQVILPALGLIGVSWGRRARVPDDGMAATASR